MKVEISWLLILGLKPPAIAKILDIKQGSIYHYERENEKGLKRLNEALTRLNK